MSSVRRRSIRVSVLAAIGVLAASGPVARAQEVYIRGKVVMEDGSPPPKAVAIYRVCPSRLAVWVAGTNKAGEFSWYDPLSLGWGRQDCVWKAVLTGYVANEIDYDTLQKHSILPNLVLHSDDDSLPAGAGPRWQRAQQAIQAKDWPAAERELRSLVTEFPKSAVVLSSLGATLQAQRRTDAAREAFQQAIKNGPGYVSSYHLLANLELDAGNYEAAEKAAAAGTRADSRNRLPALYLDLAEARYNLGSDDAEQAARKAIGNDKKHEMPEAEYVLGLILDAGKDYRSAALHFRKYLELAPNGADAPQARLRADALEEMTRRGETGAAVAAAGAGDRSMAGKDDIAVPGGLKALAAIAGLTGAPSEADFFQEYARRIAQHAADGGSREARVLAENIRTYLTVATELSSMAASAGGRLTLSLDTPANREKASRVLKLLGWRIGKREGEDYIEPADEESDAPRQLVGSALDIDELEMAKALSTGGTYRFEIRPGRASFSGMPVWRGILGGIQPGAFLEALARNPRAAGAYGALASAGPSVTEGMAAAIGLAALVNRYGDALRLYGDSFRVEGGRAETPGGPAADDAWTELAGVTPRNPAAFFPALLQRDQGKLAAFYFAVWSGDEVHRRYITASAARAGLYYKWFKTPDDFRPLAGETGPRWRQDLFRDLPLDGDGRIHFPGGRGAWTNSASDDDTALLGLATLQALPPVAALEAKRGRPLDEGSARLLSQRYSSWRYLFPYFEKLPALNPADFEALAAFEKSAAARPVDIRRAVLGEWHSLVKLAELGRAAGSLDDRAAARAFHRACEAASAPDHAAQALAALREMTGNDGDPDAAVTSRLLRLDDDRKAAFDFIRDSQKAPRLSAAVSHGAETAAALLGVVYGALLEPDTLLLSEDPHLLSRHEFLGGRGAVMFPPSTAELIDEPSGSYLQGGFMTFEAVAASLARGAALPASQEPAAAAVVAAAVASPSAPRAAPARRPAADPLAEAYFRADARLVEVYATVTEGSHYIDDLDRADITVLDNGKPVSTKAFESCTSPVSVALLLDVTGSMRTALPALKSSAIRLIDELRSIDSVAVYSFNREVYELQPFTRNKDAARRAVLGVRAIGVTGLNDALVRVTRDVTARSGKKIIVVFTDGADNASGLSSDVAIRRAKEAGVPIYTIAHGEALTLAELLINLQTLATSTGGLSFAIRDPSGIAGVFQRVSDDITHGYLLAFQPEGKNDHSWHKIEIVLKQNQFRKVRAREGYYLD